MKVRNEKKLAALTLAICAITAMPAHALIEIGDGSTIGTGATVNGLPNSIAIGNGAKIVAPVLPDSSFIANGGSVALGDGATASGSTIKIIDGQMYGQGINTAIGTSSSAIGNGSVTALGGNSQAFGTGSTALGSDSIAKNSSLAVGSHANTGEANQATAVGTDVGIIYTPPDATNPGGLVISRPVGNQSVSLGASSAAQGDGSLALGFVANTAPTAVNAIAIGNNASAGLSNSVVLGANSTDRAATSVTGTTIAGKNFTFSGVGNSANGVVSFGSAGKERQLINVASGEVSATSTDAVNGSQLYASNAAINSVSSSLTVLGDRVTVLGDTVTVLGDSIKVLGDTTIKYDNSSKDSITLAGNTTIHNVAAGVANTDAVNVGQLNSAVDSGISRANAYTDNKINGVDKDASAGIAAAMAMQMPTLNIPGRVTMHGGAAFYRGESAYAVSGKYTAQSSRWNLGVAASVSSRGDVGVSVGGDWVMDWGIDYHDSYKELKYTPMVPVNQ